MRYLALLYGKEVEGSDPGSEAFAEDLAGYERFGDLAGEAIVGGEALAPVADGFTIRYGPEGATVSEGAFAEAAEVVGGFYVLEVDDLDEAIELAQRIPAAEDGVVELRPLVEWSEEQRPLPDRHRRYVALLAGEETEADQPGTPAWDAAVAEHERFGEEAGGAILGGGALHPSETATLVRVRGGEVLVTDGTFAEATEIIGGLYLLEAPGGEAAVELARRIPMGPGGVVQLRRILELGT